MQDPECPHDMNRTFTICRQEPRRLSLTARGQRVSTVNTAPFKQTKPIFSSHTFIFKSTNYKQTSGNKTQTCSETFQTNLSDSRDVSILPPAGVNLKNTESRLNV